MDMHKKIKGILGTIHKWGIVGAIHMLRDTPGGGIVRGI